MKQNVRILGILFVVYSLLALAFRAVGLGVLALTGSHWLHYIRPATVLDVNIFTLGLFSLLLWAFTAVISILGIAAGVGLLNYRPWARVLALVLCFIYLFRFPLGTALGIYGLVVLFSAAGARLFSTPQLQRT
jgi:hypothetical protein